MTLNERIAQATVLVQKYTDLQKKDNQVKQYATLLARIEELKPAAKNTAQSFAVLYRRSPESFTKFQPLATRELRQIKNDLRAGAFPIMRIKNVNETLAGQEATLQESWKNFVKQHSSLTENTLGLLSSLQRNSARITEIINRFSNLKKAWPVSNRHLELLDEAIAAGQKILSDLSLDSEIEVFLVKVIQRKARLSDLNLRIINWLNDKNMAKYLVISIEHSKG